MSEYQCYQFDAIDRTLTLPQRKQVSQLSSHIQVLGSSAVVEYHYSDFKHDPIEVLCDYFDLFTYQANWGCQRIAFRFDAAAIDPAELSVFELDEAIKIIEQGEHLILDCYLDENWDTYPDSHYTYDDEPPAGSPFTSFYQQILEGDYRSLYLIWLRAAQLNQPDAVAPVPAGLEKLEDEHKELSNFIGLDQDLLAAVKPHSSPFPLNVSNNTYNPEELLSKLSSREAIEHLRNLLRDNPASAKAKLLASLRSKAPTPQPNPLLGVRSIPLSELDAKAGAIKAEHTRKAEEERLQRKRHYFAKLKKNQTRLWAKVTQFVERKKTKYYDYAILTLSALKQLAVEENALDAYYEQADALAKGYPKLTGLQWRLEEARVVSTNHTGRATRHAHCTWHNSSSQESSEKEYSFHLLNE